MEDDSVLHWAQEIAENAMELFGKKQVVATGWSPSGYYHIGNFREAITCRALHKELQSMGCDVTFVLNIDDMDPLEKVPAFLKEKRNELKPYLGRPLDEIPDPFGKFKTYAEYFTNDATTMIDRFDINPELAFASQFYKERRYDEYFRKYLAKREELAVLMKEISGNALRNFISLQCEKCGNIAAPTVTFDENTDFNHVKYVCTRGPRRGCGHEGEADLAKIRWKLKWRLDWPARQAFQNVTLEPAGKDHSVAGGSIDTALAIHEKILERTPLLMPRYGFINLGGKKMSGSAGLGLSVSRFAEIAPPEALLFKTYKVPLLREFDLDAHSTDMIETVRELDHAQEFFYNDDTTNWAQRKLAKAYELACVGGPTQKPPIQVDYMDLLMTLQSVALDQDAALQTLEKRGVIPKTSTIDETDLLRLRSRFTHLTKWLQNYAPQSVKFTLQQTPDLSLLKGDDVIQHLSVMLEILETEECTQSGDTIQQAMFNITRGKDLEPRRMFQLAYLLLLGKQRGPKAGPLIFSLGADKVADIVRSVIKEIQSS